MEPRQDETSHVPVSDERGHALRKMESLFSSNRKPVVDLIVTNYNYAPFLTECLQSVLAQDYDNWRCTIVDDASTDESQALIREFVDAHAERFQAVFQPQNGGQMEAMKAGLDASAGDFVAFLDSDDVLFPNFISLHLAAHLYHLNVAFTCSQMAVINGAGQVISGCRNESYPKNTGYFTYVGAEPYIWLRWPWSATSGMMFRRSVVRLAISEDTSVFRICADNLLAHFSNLVGGSLLIQEALGYYRMHGNNSFSSPSVYGMNACHGNMKVHPSPKNDVSPVLARLLLSRAEELAGTLGPGQWLSRFSTVAPLPMYTEVIRMRKKLGLSGVQLVQSLVLRYLLRLRAVVRQAVLAVTSKGLEAPSASL